MADRKVTLFELHFDGGFQIGPETMGLRRDEDEPEDEDEDADVEIAAPEGGPNPVVGLVALAALVGIALAIRRLLGGDDDEEFEQEELEEFEAA